MRRFTPAEIGFSLYLVERHVGDNAEDDVVHAVQAARAAQVPCFSRNHPPHSHEDHEVNVVVSGAGRFSWGDERDIRVVAGQVLAIPGAVPHTLEADGHVVVRGMYLHPDVLRRCLRPHDVDCVTQQILENTPALTPRLTSDAGLFATLQDLFAEAQGEYAQQYAWRTPYLQAIGQQAAILFLRLMHRQHDVPYADPAVQRVTQVQAWMDRHFFEPTEVADLAEMAHLSTAHFCVLFRQLTGTSPKAYLLQHRLQQAASLLRDTSLSVTEVALRVGFTQNVNFTHLFKARTGLSPRDYRKKYQFPPQNQ